MNATRRADGTRGSLYVALAMLDDDAFTYIATVIKEHATLRAGQVDTVGLEQVAAVAAACIQEFEETNGRSANR